MGFSRQEYWSGLPCPPPGDLPNPGIKPGSLMSPPPSGKFFTTNATWEALMHVYLHIYHKTTCWYIRWHICISSWKEAWECALRQHLHSKYTAVTGLYVYLWEEKTGRKGIKPFPQFLEPALPAPQWHSRHGASSHRVSSSLCEGQLLTNNGLWRAQVPQLVLKKPRAGPDQWESLLFTLQFADL